MSTIVEATLPADQFALAHTLQATTNVEIEIVRVVETSTEQAMPYMWISADDLDDLPEILDDDPSTENVEILTELTEEFLVRMEWVTQIRIIMYIILEENATILNARGHDEQWEFRILFPEHDSISTTSDFCDEYDIGMSFDRIYELSESARRGRHGLTETQYETLRSAYESGYYSVPREASLTDLAEQRSVSHQALSERIRRGHQELIAATLSPSDTEN